MLRRRCMIPGLVWLCGYWAGTQEALLQALFQVTQLVPAVLQEAPLGWQLS